MLNEKEKLWAIALQQSPQMGAIRARRLLRDFGSIQAIYEADAVALAQASYIGKTAMRHILSREGLEMAKRELDFVEKKGIELLLFGQSNYPRRLLQIEDAPFLLYYKGSAPLDQLRTLSVVGTRKPTENGRAACERILTEIKEFSPLIVSGLAYGIDACAHRKALDLGLETVAVLAHGLNRIYPPQHRSLAEQMLEQGGLLTEFISQNKPLACNFPMRNRIIAGLSDALWVVETGPKGGSMISAQKAIDYQRKVFALPGRWNDKQSLGCNELIRQQKALLLSKGQQLAQSMKWSQPKQGQQQQLFQQVSPKEQQITDLLLGGQQLHYNQLLAQLPWGHSQLIELLLQLEMRGLIKALAGKYYRLA